MFPTIPPAGKLVNIVVDDLWSAGLGHRLPVPKSQVVGGGAVHDDRLAGKVGGQVGGQKQDHRRDLGLVGKAAEWNGLQEGPVLFADRGRCGRFSLCPGQPC